MLSWPIMVLVAVFSELPRMAAAAGAVPGVPGMLPLRFPTPQGAPILIAPRLQQSPMQPQVSLASLMNGAAAAASAVAAGAGLPPPLMSPTEAGLLYPAYDPYNLTTRAPMLEYPGLEQSGAGTLPYVH